VTAAVLFDRGMAKAAAQIAVSSRWAGPARRDFAFVLFALPRPNGRESGKTIAPLHWRRSHSHGANTALLDRGPSAATKARRGAKPRARDQFHLRDPSREVGDRSFGRFGRHSTACVKGTWLQRSCSNTTRSGRAGAHLRQKQLWDA